MTSIPTQHTTSNDLPDSIHTEKILHAVETLKSEAEAAADKAAIVEAESAFVPDAGEKEIALKMDIAKEGANKANVLEEVAGNIIEAHKNAS